MLAAKRAGDIAFTGAGDGRRRKDRHDRGRGLLDIGIAAAGHGNRGGYTDELEFTRLLLNNAETRQRVESFLAGSSGFSMQVRKGAA